MRIVFALCLALLAAPMAVAADAQLTVPVDQGRVVNLLGSAASISIGNTEIADVRPVDSRTLIVLGKRPGVTNLIVMDAAGRTLFDERVLVSANAGSAVTVYRGSETVEMACSPYCQSLDAAAAAATLAP